MANLSTDLPMTQQPVARMLIAYDTTEGQTRKIARHMAEVVARRGCEVEVLDIRRPPSGFSPDGFDAILVGASVHMSKHSRQVVQFIGRHHARLEAVCSGFFSVSLSAAGSDKEKAAAVGFVEALLQQTGWSPTVRATFAGGLRYRDYGFLKRWMMKKIARDAGKDTDTSKNHEYTDFSAVDQFINGLLANLEPRPTQESKE